MGRYCPIQNLICSGLEYCKWLLQVRIFFLPFLFSKWQKLQLQLELQQHVKCISWRNILNSSQAWFIPGTEHWHLSLLALHSSVSPLFSDASWGQKGCLQPQAWCNPLRFKPNRKSTHLTQQTWQKSPCLSWTLTSSCIQPWNNHCRQEGIMLWLARLEESSTPTEPHELGVKD